MLRVAIRQVRPEHVDRLRDWLREVNGPRRSEALATLEDEGCRHEQAYLINGVDGPVIVYVMEVEDVERSTRAAAHSRHPIDAEHRRIMDVALGPPLSAELLLDLALSDGPRPPQRPADEPGVVGEATDPAR